jgi:OOP family OmpA-OmpF porin
MNNFKKMMLVSALFAGIAFKTSLAHAAVDPRAFGERWQSQGTPGNQQSQVIYYRGDVPGGTDAALVYVDGEFQAALLPGMFTRFCVAPGSHTLGAYIHDAPRYQGKTDEGFRATLKAGKTYFVRVDADVNGRPQPVHRVEAEKELSEVRLQKHALSRASAVVACDYDQAPQVDYIFSSDVLFNFGKSGINDVQTDGRRSIEALVARLKQDQVENNRIEIIGHTDGIGQRARNLQLGADRAATVQQLMLSQGLPAKNLTTRSVANDEPVVQCARGSRAEQIRCNAPNRRVVVRVTSHP